MFLRDFFSGKRAAVATAAGLIVLAAGVSPILAQHSVTLAWAPNSEPDVIGYRLRWGPDSGNYTMTLDVGNTTTATVSLAEVGDYFIVVTAINNASLESLPSNEVVYTVEPNEAPAVSLTNPTEGANFDSPTNIQCRGD